MTQNLGHLMFTWATQDDAQQLAENLHPQEELEVRRFSGRNPVQAIERSVRMSAEAVSIWSPAGQLLGITGVQPFTLLGGAASPWLLNTSGMRRHPRQLLVGTKILLKRWRSQYRLLVNYIDADYEEALRWARWAGFTVFDACPRHGVSGAPMFCRIEMKGD